MLILRGRSGRDLILRLAAPCEPATRLRPARVGHHRRHPRPGGRDRHAAVAGGEPGDAHADDQEDATGARGQPARGAGADPRCVEAVHVAADAAAPPHGQGRRSRRGLLRLQRWSAAAAACARADEQPPSPVC